MEIHLKKPIVTFDIEATGLNVAKDRIIEIAILKVFPDMREETYQTQINPEVEISREIEELTGISNQDVQDKPKFGEVAHTILAFIEDCDLVGYNFHKLDIPMLAEEFLRVGIDFDIEDRKLIDVQNIFHKMEQRTLAAAYLFYCQKNLEDAHTAMADTKATWEVLNAQLTKYPSLNKDVDSLADFSKNSQNKYADFAGRLVRNEKGEVEYNFGKHKGKTVEETNKIEPGYFGWFIGDSTDFPNYTKNVLRKEMERIKNKSVKLQATDNISMEDKINALKNKFGK
jgi:DNA polymerase-3 subunit epsilon